MDFACFIGELRQGIRRSAPVQLDGNSPGEVHLKQFQHPYLYRCRSGRQVECNGPLFLLPCRSPSRPTFSASRLHCRSGWRDPVSRFGDYAQGGRRKIFLDTAPLGLGTRCRPPFAPASLARHGLCSLPTLTLKQHRSQCAPQMSLHITRHQGFGSGYRSPR